MTLRLTQSILGSAGDCGLKAQYALDRPSWARKVGGSRRAVGTAYHAGLELLYRARMNGLELPSLAAMVEEAVSVFDTSTERDLYDDTALDEFKWDEKVPDREVAVDFITRMLTEYVEGGHVWPDDWRVLATEFNGWFADPEIGPDVETKLGADLVLLDPNGWVVLDDHKTAGRAWEKGKESPRKNIQGPFYLRNARRQFPGAHGYRFVFSVMTYPNSRSGPKFERRIADPYPIHEQAVAKKARDFAATYSIVHNVNGLDLPANPASTLCSPLWCDFFEGCPFGAALESAA